MLDLFFINLILNLIDKQIMLSSYSKKEIANLLIPKYDEHLSNKEIELKKKEAIDHLINKLGFIGALKEIYSLGRDVSNLKQRFLDSRTASDISLFQISISSLIHRISEIYKANIYLKVYAFFSRIENGTFDEKIFLETIYQESIRVDYLLGIEEPNNEQVSLFSESKNDVNPTEESIINSYKNRNIIISEVTTRIRNVYSKFSIMEYCEQMIRILKEDRRIESKILASIISEIDRELRKAKIKRLNFKSNKNQIKIETKENRK